MSYYLLIDLEFVIATELPQWSTIIVRIPQVDYDPSYPYGTSEPVVVEKYSGFTNSWKGNWFANNQTLELTTSETLKPGKQQFTIGSQSMSMSDNIIYADDTSITFSLKDPYGVTAAGGVFDEVVARGMESSSLTFDTPVKDSTTGIHISFTGENYLQPNDRVNVYLPDFTVHASSSLQDGDAVPFTGDTSAVTMRWRDSLQALEMTLVESIKTVEVNIPKGTFMMGPFGANNYSTAVYSTDSKLPTISLRTENFRYFAPTPFQVFTPVGFFANR